MFPRLATRVLRTTDLRCLWKFLWNFSVKGALSVEKFKRRIKRGEYFPPFIYISITSACNLRCQGCWVDVDRKVEQIDLNQMNRLIIDAKKHGNRFFGILGGEPFMHPQLFEIMAAHPDCYFQLFTNGQFMTDKAAAELRRLGNVTPLISIEGLEKTSDERRGKKDVYNKSFRGLETSLKHRLLTGVASSVCQSNIDELVNERWLQKLIDLGVHYAWFHIYRPAGAQMNPQLALTAEQQIRVRKFVVEMRSKMPIGIVDAYYDRHGQALCPMVTGLNHHISPRGEIEPCPVIQFATDNIADPRGIYETMRSSAYLRDFRETVSQATRGCVVLERPDLIKALVLKHQARDTTSRGTALAEVELMEPRSSQYMPGQETPEGHWMYQLGKRFLFHDFGAYKNLKPAEVKKTLK